MPTALNLSDVLHTLQQHRRKIIGVVVVPA